MTRELLGYLGSPDPDLRDHYGHFILGTWIARGHYSPPELRSMALLLSDKLSQGIGEQGIDSVLLRSFSVLILGEIVARDHRDPFLEQAELWTFWTAASVSGG